MTAPLVSIGIPTFARLPYLIEAVESALSQTWSRVEVLVGDDGTTNEIADWCERRATNDPRLTYHRNPRTLGLAGNWNAIVDRASGEFVVLMGDDDRLLPDFSERLVAAAASDTDLVFCNHHVVDAGGQRLPDDTTRITRQYHRDDLPTGRVPAAACAWNLSICPSAALVRRAHLRRLRFDEELNSPDVELYIRLAGEGARFDFVPDYLVEYRTHGASMTASGLRNDLLAARLLPVAVSEDVEPLKRELLERLLVNAVSRCLQQGDGSGARRFLDSRYYPRSSRRLSYFMQQTCAALPGSIGTALYRTLVQVRHAAGR